MCACWFMQGKSTRVLGKAHDAVQQCRPGFRYSNGHARGRLAGMAKTVAVKTAKELKPTRKAWQPLLLYDHQREVVNAYKNEGILRFFLPWHRRAGKDVFSMDFTRERMLERVGVYWHLFPFHTQARRAIWKGIDARTGERFIDRAFPPAMRKSENDTEMSITLKNGAVWQMLGSDNYDRAIGANPCGLAFSEWALCNPAAWDYLRPILVENKGWAAFITTFRGRNHAWRMYQTVKDLPNWFCSLRTIKDTHKHDGTPIITDADVAREIREGMSNQLARQEFYCDPDAATDGAIFARQSNIIAGLRPITDSPNSRVLRVAWGMREDAITAIAFQGSAVYGVHPFREVNLADCVQAVTRRHPAMQLIHHAVNPDSALFSELDGYGVAGALLPNGHQRDGITALMLNMVSATETSKQQLEDFALQYAPYRQSNDEDETIMYPATAEALAVMYTAQQLNRATRPVDYSRADRGVI